MISYEKNFIFIHIPKTGGTSVETALKSVVPDMGLPELPTTVQADQGADPNRKNPPTFNRHTKLPVYRTALGDEVYERFFKFSCVRNPWERHISHFFSPHLGRIEWDRDAFLEFIAPRVPMLTWIRRPGAGSKKWSVRIRNYMARNPIIGVDYLMRFENLRADFAELCERLDLPNVEIPHANAGPHRDYSKFYDRELIEIVGERFREDVEAFGYEPPRPGA